MLIKFITIVAMAMLDTTVSAEGVYEREAQPIERTAPRYPRKCLRTHTQVENITIEFSISKEGIVEDVKIISSTNECFNDASIKAVKKWKYAPKIVEGQKVRRYGVRTNFRYVPAKNQSGKGWIYSFSTDEYPLTPEANRLLSEAYIDILQKKKKRALSKVDQVINAEFEVTDRDLATAYRIKGLIYFMSDPIDIKSGVEFFQKSLSYNALAPDIAIRMNTILGTIFFKLEKYEIAQDFFTQTVLDKEKRTAQNVFFLSLCYGQTGEAVLELRTAKLAAEMSNYKNKAYLEHLNSVYAERNMREERIILLEKITEAWPEDDLYKSQLEQLKLGSSNPQITTTSSNNTLDISRLFSDSFRRSPKPKKRVAPIYPKQCAEGHTDIEYVKLKYDVTKRGKVVNITVDKTSNSCFSESAIKAIKKWTYFRPSSNSDLDILKNVTTTFKYIPAK